MGQETTGKNYTQQDYDEFYQRLKAETEILGQWLKSQKPFINHRPVVGYELECWLTHENGHPAPLSPEFLNRVQSDQITPELSKFNFEINGTPYDLVEGFCENLEKDIHRLYHLTEEAAQDLDSHVLFMGTYPNLTEDDLNESNITPSNRYAQLNKRINSLRKKDAEININGKDSLNRNLKSILFESQATSLQIHLQTNLSEAKDLYNASVLASPFMAALCANSPFVCGNELWHETRIPIFEQTVSLYRKQETRECSRVGLGDKYVSECISELFEENLNFPILLPELKDHSLNQFSHLKFHNGTIWRWNRPIIDFCKDGSPHIRIEHRVPSSGPTLIDVQANIVFYIGLALAIKNIIKDSNIIDFKTNEANFYQASKDGLKANIKWINGEEVEIADFINFNLCHLVKKELLGIGLKKTKIDLLIDTVIKNRVKTLQTGSQWQINYCQKHNNDFYKMIKQYREYQVKNIPVYLWPLD